MHAPSKTNGGGETGWKDSYKTAQMITLPDVTRVCGDQAGQFIRDLARGSGCPVEYILMPLLSCSSALMGHQTEIRVHEGWSEPPVLWVVIGANAGTRKSSALRQVLSPLMSLSKDARRTLQQLKHDGKEDTGVRDTAVSSLQLPVVCAGALAMQNLRTLSQEGIGGVLHLTERLEESHQKLGMHAQHVDNNTHGPLHDLYEALVVTLPPTQSTLNGTPPGGVGNSGTLSHILCYNQCGFASPEYVVNLTVKAPNWLSGRFLVSCPSTDNITNRFPLIDDSDNDSEGDDEDNIEGGDSFLLPPSAKKPRKDKKKCRLKLRDVYFHIARVHSHKHGTCRYLFTKDAVRELSRFQEEEWRTILNQLGGEDNGGAVGKSLGQVVRLAGVLKALKEASAVAATCSQSPDCSEDESFLQCDMEGDHEVKIDSNDVTGALELGKYFLEQKLSMTFMVSSGFFRNRSGSRSGSSHQNEPPQDSSRPSVSTCSLPQTSDFSFVPPHPIDPVNNNNHYGFPKMGTFPQPQSSGSMMGSSAAPGSSGFPHPHHPNFPPTSSPMTPMASSPQNPPPFPFNFDGLRGGGVSGGGGGGGGVGGAAHAALSSIVGSRTYHLPLSHNSIPHNPPSSSSSASASAASPHTSQEIDVALLPATWIPTTTEEEMAEMSHAAEFVHLEPQQFVAVHARRVKRLLECFDDGCGVSATTAAQKSIAPPVRVAGTNNRHPAWASALFFQKVGDLGLGVAQQVRHPTNGRVYWRFKRKSVTELTEKNYQLLQYLRVDMVRFSRQGPVTMHLPSLPDLDMTLPGGVELENSVLEEAGSNSSSKGNNSPLESEIKQEVV